MVTQNNNDSKRFFDYRFFVVFAIITLFLMGIVGCASAAPIPVTGPTVINTSGRVYTYPGYS